MSDRLGDTDPAPRRPLVLRFDDNRLLPALFGVHDKHLVQVEQRLGVTVINRGNQLVIQGGAEATATAQAALDSLYDRLRRGEPVDEQEVDAALRLAQAPAGPTGAAEPVLRTRRRRIAPRGPAQRDYIEALSSKDLIFGLGPAGTGKTYLAVVAGVAELLAGRVERLIFSRPAVEAGERLGFLPGDMREKVDPYLRPIYDALYDCMPADQVEKRMDSGDIEIAPLAFMRGRTLRNAFVLLDEAQNASAVQMKMVLTRLGEGGRMVVTGDPSQVDLPSGQRSGLLDALDTLEGVDGLAVVRFTQADVIRHPLVARIIDAYDARDRAAREAKRAETP